MAGVKGMKWGTVRSNLSDHPLYERWKNMRKRCRNPSHPKFELYGGRGITVCGRWDDFELFLKDVAPLGPCPPGMSIDRIDNCRGYEPGNVRWASTQEQLANRRPYRPRTLPPRERLAPPSHQKLLVHDDGVVLTNAHAAELLGCKPTSLQRRLARIRRQTPDLKRIDIQLLRR